VGPGPTRMRPGGTRVGQGNRPFAAGRPKSTMGSYNRIVQEAGISFHRFSPKWERLLPVDSADILLSTIRGLRGTLRIHQGIRGAPPRGRCLDGRAFRRLF
jgi:hypothetical protein